MRQSEASRRNESCRRRGHYGRRLLVGDCSAFRPIDADYAVRRLFTGTAESPTATWRAAELLGAKPMTADSRISAGDRWVNYYGPPETFSSVNLAQALAPEGLPDEFFKDRIVMVGGRAVLGTVGLGKDQFATPYSAAGHGFSTGLEIHANILLNLLRGEWLTRLSPRTETLFVIAFGLAARTARTLAPDACHACRDHSVTWCSRSWRTGASGTSASGAIGWCR